MANASLAHVEPAVQDRIQLTIKQMDGEISRRDAVDVFKWWTFMATDVIGELSFGQSFQTLEHGEVYLIKRKTRISIYGITMKRKLT